MKIKGTLFTIISAIIFGFTPALANITYSLGNNALSMTFYRNLFVIPILLIVIKYKKIELKVSHYDLKNIFTVSIFGVAATTVLLYSSYFYIGIGTATTLHFMYPIFVALACRYIFNEKLGKKKIYALVLAFTGVLFFIDTGKGGNIIGVMMALTSSITYSFYLVWVEKKRLVKIIPYKLSLYIASFVSGALLIANVFFGYLRVLLPLKAYILIIIISFLTSFIAIILLQIGISLIGSSSAAIFCLFEPITSVISGTLIFNESITIYKIIGCLIIFFSITYLEVKK